MKKLLFLLAIPIYFFTVSSCNQSGTKSNKTDSTSNTITVDSAKLAPCGSINIKDWEIDLATAKKLKDHRQDHGNDMSNIIDYNDCVRNAIMKAYPADATGVWEEARYKDDGDETRYSNNRKIPNEPDGTRGKNGRVKDYKTKIFVVTVKPKGQADPVYYYDIATICPPPDACPGPIPDSAK